MVHGKSLDTYVSTSTFEDILKAEVRIWKLQIGHDMHARYCGAENVVKETHTSLKKSCTFFSNGPPSASA